MSRKMNREMNRKTILLAACAVAVFFLAFGTSALAQDGPWHFSGLINDYTPQTVNPAGPWEVRGSWSLDLEDFGHRANFSAALNMTRSDYWIVLNPSAVNDDTAATGRNPHTHNITMTNAVVTSGSGSCAGLEATGAATISANGGAAPFASLGATTLTVCITGGANVKYSNVTLTFSYPASTHFGMQPVHGVVRKTN